MFEISFSNPVFLWILLLIPFMIIIHFFTLTGARKTALKFSNFEALERVTEGEFLIQGNKASFGDKNILLLIIRIIIYALLILSVCGVTISYLGNSSDFDFSLAIDVSSSMMAGDFEPSRLEAAKQAAHKFLDRVPKNSNISLVTFSSAVFIEEESESDYDKIKETIDSISFKETGGTNIGDAIITSVNQLKTDKSKVVVLLTDGRTNTGVNIQTAIDYAKERDVMIYTIGIGTKEGGSFLGDIVSPEIISRLDEATLISISEQTGGKYFKADNQEVLENAFSEVASSSKRVISHNISWILLIIGLLLLATEWLLLYTIYKTIP